MRTVSPAETLGLPALHGFSVGPLFRLFTHLRECLGGKRCSKQSEMDLYLTEY